MTSRCSLRPLVVAKPSWSILTLTVTGTPASGPASSPRAIAASTAAACASTSSGRWSTTALIVGLTASSRASAADGRLLRRNLFRPDQGGEIGGRQTPEILHGQLRLIARLVALADSASAIRKQRRPAMRGSSAHGGRDNKRDRRSAPASPAASLPPWCRHSRGGCCPCIRASVLAR